MNIYVGNLHYGVDEEDLRGIFEEYGEVTSVKLIMDKFTGKSKGFAFVEMGTSEAGQAAIAALNEAELEGRNMKVNEARERTEDSRPSNNRRPSNSRRNERYN
ncbi:MAG: RNA-binding protein [Bacteroidetes bacterium HGW-Bacteroidetes-4]|jgi:RNA recognition motif-containing protein|nr:MAG: RNA-binding protein [Bacteroidetes bacterium HGW-Bacteroidetes-4]